MATAPQFLITAAEYRANIRRQKMHARIIWWKERLEEPLEEWERGFLRYQRAQPIPNEAGRPGRPLSGRGLSDAEYALLRTGRLSEDADYLNPNGKGAPRRHDNTAIAMHVAYRIRFDKWRITRAWGDAQRAFKVTKEQVRYAWDKYGYAATAHHPAQIK